MKHFHIRALICLLVMLLGVGISIRLVFLEDYGFNSESAYETASWLSKHGIKIDKELIDTAKHDVYEFSISTIAGDKDSMAQKLIGADMKKSAADTYTGEKGTLVFSKMNFELRADEGNEFSIDRYNAAKTAERFIKNMGIDISGSIITAIPTDEGYAASVTKTIGALPVFNNAMSVKMTEDEIVNVSGVWYNIKSGESKKRSAKSAVYALREYIRKSDGDEKEISAMELGYLLEETDAETTRVKPVWRITDSDGVVLIIDA